MSPAEKSQHKKMQWIAKWTDEKKVISLLG